MKVHRITIVLDPVKEKMTRGFIKSNTEKYISSETIVIVDSMNYIKGFRYELYCLARASKTTNCLLYVNTPYEICKQQNTVFPEEL
jgi:protein KTI12